MSYATAWVDGLYSTQELDWYLTDPEYLRYLADEYWEELHYRWEHLWAEPSASPRTWPKPRPAVRALPWRSQRWLDDGWE